MKDDQISRFKTARNEILRGKQELELQLGQINAALAVGDDPKAVSPRPRKDSQLRKYGDLTTAVAKALAQGPLTKREIIGCLQAQKFQFAGPALKVLDSVIYTPHFTRNGKLFALAKPNG